MKRNSFFKLLLMFLAGLLTIFIVSSCTPNNVKEPEATETSPEASKHLTIEEAMEVAKIFLKKNPNSTSELRAMEDETLSLAFQEPTSSVALRSANSNDELSSLPAYYVFNIGEKGYIIVSAWDATIPILGYSDEGAFFSQEYAEKYPSESANVISFLGAYANCIDSIRQNAVVDETLKQQRDNALRSSVTTQTTRAYNSIAPLLGNIKWGQSPYYNAYCPPGTPVGCVATATCQIMKYWEYPEYGRGSHRSTHDGQYANFEHRLNWKNMPAATLRGRNHDVAQLCYDVAVGINMMFGRNGSGTWQYYVPDLLTKHYYYKNTVQDIYRDRYSTSQWENIVYNELSKGRPVQYAGAGSGGGHSFVCDGYNNGYFHINWGWAGMSDGYFLLHALNPGSLGTGGGSGGFNYGQDIVIGIEPANQPNPTPTPDPTPDPDPTPTPNDKYCESTGRYAKTTFINRVKFSNVDNKTYSNSGGYNYFKDQTIYLKNGHTYELTVVPGATNGSYYEYWRVWIDLDGDKNFVDDEMATEFVTYSSNRAVTKKIYIPQHTTNKVTRMRVSMKWGSYPKVCETFDHGEVEDYPVRFTDKTPNPDPVDPTPTPDPVDPTPTPDPIDPTPDPINYPESHSKDSYYGFIHTVELGDMTNASKKGQKYANYSSDSKKYIKASAGNSLIYKFVPGFSGSQSYWCYWRAWIDYNRNGLFESNEQVVSKYGWQSVNGWFSLPFRMEKGFYRVRVSMKMNEGYPASNEIFNYGEVEDYSLYIQ